MKSRFIGPGKWRVQWAVENRDIGAREGVCFLLFRVPVLEDIHSEAVSISLVCRRELKLC